MTFKRAVRKDVAVLAGVSDATVSHVFNNTKHITPEVRRRVLSAAAELHYTPNLVAKSLATNKTHHVVLLIDNLKNPRSCELLEGVQAAASESGYIVSVIAADTSNASSIIELAGRGVDGIINALAITDLSEIFGVMIPSVFEGKHIKYDYYPAMSQAVHMLKLNGHRRIAYLSSVPLNTPNYGLLDSLKRALAENGLPIEPALFIEGEAGCRANEETGLRLADMLLKKEQSFTAAIAINDLVAVGAARSFTQHGFSVPGDVSVVGCDNLKILDYLPTGISSIDTQAFKTGRLLMNALISEMRGGEWTVPTIVCEFINREGNR